MKITPFLNEVDLRSACRMVWEAQTVRQSRRADYWRIRYGWLCHGCMAIADCCYDYRPLALHDNLYSPDAFRGMQRSLPNIKVHSQKGAA